MSSKTSDLAGEPTQTGTTLLEKATAAIQGFGPINKIHQHLCAFHMYSEDMTRQVEAHHFCAHLNEDVRQCLIYEGPGAEARLIGVEYVVAESIFRCLPEEEKPLWHSHEYEVKSGLLFMPDVPGPVQRQDMDTLAKTYGKTFHFWQIDLGHSLPLGLPQLMMSFTRDGQLHPHLAVDVEKRFGISFKEEREKRSDMKGPDYGIDPKANGQGKGLKTELRETDLSISIAAPGADPLHRVFV